MRFLVDACVLSWNDHHLPPQAHDFNRGSTSRE